MKTNPLVLYWVGLTLLSLLLLQAVVMAQGPAAPGSPKAVAKESPGLVSRLSENAIVVPMRYHPLTSPQPIIYLSVDGSKPLPFLLDTGLSQGVVFTQETVDQLKLTVGEKVRYLFPDPNPYREVHVGKFNLVGGAREITLRPLRGVYVEPQGVGNAGFEHVTRTVGALFLEPFVAQFDFEAQKLRLLVAKDYQPPIGEDVQVIPLIPLDSVRPIIKVELGKGESVAFVIDTGASNTLLIERLAAKLLTKTVDGTSFSVAGTQPTKVGLLNKIKLGGFTVTNVLAGRYPDSLPPEATEKTKNENNNFLLNQSFNLMGNDILDQFLMTVDITHNRVILEPYEKGKTISARRIGQPQVKLSIGTRGCVVSDIRKDSSPFKIGDVIDSVDGIGLRSLSLSQSQRVLDGIAETFASVIIRRGLDIMNIKYRRHSVIPSD